MVRQATIKHTGKEKEECTRCGYVHEPKKCPAYGKICNECSRKNHFSCMCKTPKHKGKPRKVHEIGQQKGAELFIGTTEMSKHLAKGWHK